MIGFRKGYPRWPRAAFTLIQAAGGILVVHPRTRRAQALLCVQHDQHGAARRLPPGEWRQDTARPSPRCSVRRKVTLPPYQAYFGAQEAT
jgi:alpha-glucosidase